MLVKAEGERREKRGEEKRFVDLDPLSSARERMPSLDPIQLGLLLPESIEHDYHTT